MDDLIAARDLHRKKRSNYSAPAPLRNIFRKCLTGFSVVFVFLGARIDLVRIGR